MFQHTKRLQYEVKPDALFAKKVQEVLGGQYGEMTVMTHYLLPGWSCRGPAKYKDMLLDISTEEIGYVEMLSTLIAPLPEGVPPWRASARARRTVSATPGAAPT